MPDVIEPAASGRAKCRGCGRAIQKGELRFGEALANPYGEGETRHWFHLECAALMRPDKLGPSLSASETEVLNREDLLRIAVVGVAFRRLPRLVRAERAPSGRARCRLCRELIEKGQWRLALQLFEEGRPSPNGHIHVHCAEAYLGTADILDRIVRLTPDLSDSDTAEISRLLSEQRPAPEQPPAETAPLAKTQGEEQGAAAPIAINAPGSSRLS